MQGIDDRHFLTRIILQLHGHLDYPAGGGGGGGRARPREMPVRCVGLNRCVNEMQRKSSCILLRVDDIENIFSVWHFWLS